MKLTRHFVASFVIFAALISTFVLIYDSGLVDTYNVTKGDVMEINITDTAANNNLTENSGNIADQFKEMNLIEGINQITNSIRDLSPGSTGVVDILGTLVSLGLGILKTISGVITAPFSIVNIIGTYYGGELFGTVLTALAVLASLYVGFILLSAYLGKDV